MAEQTSRFCYSPRRLHSGDSRRSAGQRFDPDDTLHVRPSSPESAAGRIVSLGLFCQRPLGPDHRDDQRLCAELVARGPQHVSDDVLPAGKRGRKWKNLIIKTIAKLL